MNSCGCYYEMKKKLSSFIRVLFKWEVCQKSGINCLNFFFFSFSFLILYFPFIYKANEDLKTILYRYVSFILFTLLGFYLQCSISSQLFYLLEDSIKYCQQLPYRNLSEESTDYKIFSRSPKKVFQGIEIAVRKSPLFRRCLLKIQL